MWCVHWPTRHDHFVLMHDSVQIHTYEYKARDGRLCTRMVYRRSITNPHNCQFGVVFSIITKTHAEHKRRVVVAVAATDTPFSFVHIFKLRISYWQQTYNLFLCQWTNSRRIENAPSRNLKSTDCSNPRGNWIRYVHKSGERFEHTHRHNTLYTEWKSCGVIVWAQTAGSKPMIMWTCSQIHHRHMKL